MKTIKNPRAEYRRPDSKRTATAKARARAYRAARAAKYAPAEEVTR